MSLVPDYSSDSETSDTEQVVNTQPQKRTLSSILPPPKEKKSIYVDLPADSLDDNDEDQKPVKRTKTTAGFSIADLLPAPKNNRGGLTMTGADKPSAALSLAKKLREKKEEKKQEEVTATVVEEEEEEQVEEQPKKYTGPFFRIGKELKEDEPVIESTPRPIQPTLGLEYTVERPKEPEKTAVDAYEYDPNAMYSADPSAYYYYQQQHQESQSIADDDDNNELDDLQHLVGHRARGEQKIQIKTVNQADMLPSEEWRAQHALIQAPKFDDGISLTASKLQLKKNNIMALAAHAVSNREKLDNMFAEQRKTKRDAARKYAFSFLGF
ncbi:hypothetical protein BCV72DRAFT_249300 [Rhizopus microsporus var. microsporus]|uniref:Proline-rich protein PRCC n=1 Tax=Rhizopus microsporus var. microsporus TaxID=86635 RepID=A0A1X0R6J7_RHIZD|nr:hypothetical protein BCV72DRAFT_249300 [Rhizopus microsporus var. microsporus]